MAEAVNRIDRLWWNDLITDVGWRREEEFHFAGRQILDIADGFDVVVGAFEKIRSFAEFQICLKRRRSAGHQVIGAGQIGGIEIKDGLLEIDESRCNSAVSAIFDKRKNMVGRRIQP